MARERTQIFRILLISGLVVWAAALGAGYTEKKSINRSPAVLDWPVDHPSGENAEIYEKIEVDFEEALKTTDRTE